MSTEMKLFPLTHPQKGIWYTEKVYTNTSIGNIAGTMRIKGEIDYVTLEKALNIFVEKNDSIRLRIVDDSEEPKQYIFPYTYKKFDFFDFSQKGLEELYKWDVQQTQIPFDLTDSDLFYFAIIKINDHEGGFYAKIHHMVCDAWSIVQFANQVIDNYYRLVNGSLISDQNQPSYLEYILKEEEYKCSDRFQKDRMFWNEKFSTIPELAALKNKSSNYTSSKAKRKTFVIPEKLTSKIRQYCNETKTSIFGVFLSVMSVYINRITAKEDIVIGSPVLNRSNAIEKATTGMFVSTVPIRINVEANIEFTEFVKGILKDWISLLRHQRYPYDLLLKDIREKHKGVDKLYDITLSYQNAKFIKDEYTGDHVGRWHFNGHQSESLNIHINDREDNGNLILDYDYQTESFTLKAIEYIHDHLLNLLQDAMKNPSKKLFEIEIMSEEEKQRVLYEFNNTKTDYPKDKTIHQLFEEQVERTPDSVAVVFEDKQLTYRELNSKSNQLARVLRQKGVKSDEIVGIMVHRSLEMIIGIMAILKAGGAYLPIDPEYPEERIRFMLKDSNAGVLLTQNDLIGKVDFSGEIIDIEDICAYAEDSSNLQNVNTINSLAYVIYTSGSTGTPKGVALQRGSLNNLIKGITDRVDLYPGKTILSITTISFDIFIFETLIPLVNGLKIIIANEEQQRLPKSFNKLIISQKVDIVQTTPSRMQIFADDEECRECFEVLSDILLGGEAFPKILFEKLKKLTKARIFNGYGPTETTVYSTFKYVTDVKELNIGKPLSNTQVYILDKHLNSVPIGVPGELYIAGDGLARGYLNKDDLTSERFIQNPFYQGERMYKTGDLARWFPGGDIEYLGRIDHQVKIRGLRIELGEIENRLLGHYAVKKAVVIDREDIEGKKYLCAYIVSDIELPVIGLRDFLAKQLPSYMIPSYFVRIEKIPLSPNGKINRHELPQHDEQSTIIREYIAPTNSIERKLQNIWFNTLKIVNIGINDNFFELGGDSLNLITIISHVQKEFKVDLPLTDIYKNPTIKGISDCIMCYSNIACASESDGLVLIKKGSSKTKNLFLVHAGSGEVEVYTEFCSGINDDFNCWGIRMNRIDNYCPQNISVEELATEYISRIKTLQSGGPYYIIGWCIGGTIAFEMVRILEQMNEQINFLGLINSIAPKEWESVNEFSINTEKLLVQEIFNKNINDFEFCNMTEMDKVWPYVLSKVECGELDNNILKSFIPDDVVKAIPNYNKASVQQIIYYINVIRTLHNARAFYFPQNRINTNVYYFDACDDYIIKDKEFNKSKWNLCCSSPLKLLEIQGDHYSILKAPNVRQISETLNYIID